jgi:DNA-binding transcriptional LysR family regulator
VTRNLDISLLRAFVAVADYRNMTAASQNLHLTQGAVSQQIARLEAITESSLLHRDRRGVSLTSAGERLLEI